jgi:NADH:ubiquinone reductase (H+-translocating)
LLAGFGGLAAAKGLKRSPVNVLLIDHSNHLSASSISGCNFSSGDGAETGVDAASKQVIVDADARSA